MDEDSQPQSSLAQQDDEDQLFYSDDDQKGDPQARRLTLLKALQPNLFNNDDNNNSEASQSNSQNSQDINPQGTIANQFYLNDKSELLEYATQLAQQKKEVRRQQMKSLTENATHKLTDVKIFTICKVLRNILMMIRTYKPLENRNSLLSRFSFQTLVEIKAAKNAIFKKKAEVLLSTAKNHNVYSRSQLMGLCDALGIHFRFLGLVELMDFRIKKDIRLLEIKKNKKLRKSHDSSQSSDEDSSNPNPSKPGKATKNKKGTKKSISLETIRQDPTQLNQLAHSAKPPKNSKTINVAKLSESESSEAEFVEMADFMNPRSKKVAQPVAKKRPERQENHTTTTKQTFFRNPQSQQFTWLQLYDDSDGKWRVLNTLNFNIYDEESLKKQFHELQCVFVYSLQPIRPAPWAETLFERVRPSVFKLEDQTLVFTNKIYTLKKKRNFLRLRKILFELCEYFDFRCSNKYLSQLQLRANKAQEDIIRDVNYKQFPKTNKEMYMSDYFVTEDTLGKFGAITRGAKPIPGLYLEERPVYLKKDVCALHSVYGWADLGRKIKNNEKPARVTRGQRRKDKELNLYEYSQTQPFRVEIDEDGHFIRNEFNNLYVPAEFTVPEGTTLIDPNMNVNYVCRKNDMRYAEVMQGFSNMGIPIRIGTLVYKEDEERIVKMYWQRKEYLEEKKKASLNDRLRETWKKLFKSIKVVERFRQLNVN